MAKGVDLGTGWINVVPTFKGMSKAVTDSLGDVSGIGPQAGGKIGSSLGAGITSRLGSVTSSIGSAFAGAFDVVAKSAAAAGAAAATGLAAAVKGSISAYGEYEQLVGGVETLFKDNAGTVQKYASQAYKTAGMSANQYMETITGFSASLLQGLGGDTAKAAEIGNRAVIDMSDNANKMGTDMGRITDAYQGFAKQNYTMLDNLKLGYGGTKEEMARLISDASKLTDVQAQLGVTVDESSMSFDNIVNAISVVQKNMDITGTTALEAAGTLQGSMAMMKASWTDLLTAFGSGENVDAAMGNFLASLETYLGNLVPIAKRAAGNIVEALRGELEARFPVLAAPFEQLEGILGSVFESFADADGTVTLESLASRLAEVAGGITVLSGARHLLGDGEFLPALNSLAGEIDGIAPALRESSGKISDWASSLKDEAQLVGVAFQDLASAMVPEGVKDVWGAFGEDFSSMFGQLGDAVGNAAGALRGKLSEAGAAVSEFASTRVPGPLAELGASLRSRIGELSGPFGEFSAQVRDFAGKAAEPLGGLGQRFAGFFSPGNLTKLFAVGALGGALVAAIGAVASQGGAEAISQMTATVTSVIDRIPAFVSNLTAQLPQFMEVGMQIIQTVGQAIIDNLPTIVEAATGLLTTLATGLGENLPTLIPMALEIILTLVQALLENIPAMLEAGVNVLIGLAEGLIGALPALIGMAPVIIEALAGQLLSRLPQIIETGIQLLVSLIDGLVACLPDLVKMAPIIIHKLADAILPQLPTIVQTGITLIGELGKGLIQALPDFLLAAPELIAGLAGALRDLLPDLLQVGKDLLRGIADGVTSVAGELWDAMVGAVGEAFDGVKDFFGIASPSKKLRDEVGRWLPPGIAVGFEQAMPAATRSIGKELDEMVDSVVGRTMTIPVDTTQLASLPAGDGSLFGVSGGVVFNIGSINNPAAEPSSTTLARELQKTGAGVGLF